MSLLECAVVQEGIISALVGGDCECGLQKMDLRVTWDKAVTGFRNG